MSKIIINQYLCKKCGICVMSCPETIFVQKEKDAIPEFTHEELCLSCGHCIAICPQGAINHMDFLQGSIKLVNQEIIPSLEQIIEMVRTRRSIRDKIVELTASYLAKTVKQFRNPLIRKLLLMVARNEIESALRLQPYFDRVTNEVQNGKDMVLFNAPALFSFNWIERRPPRIKWV
jgi:ferredoxin